MTGSTLRVIAWLLASSTWAMGQQGRVTCRLSPDVVYQGDPAEYQVEVFGGTPDSEPVIPAVQGVSLQMVGTLESNRSFNGRRSSSLVYRYLVRSDQLGTFTIPAPDVTLGGEVLKGTPVTLTVRPPDEQDLVHLALRLTPATAYPTQTVTANLLVFVHTLPEDDGRRDPLSVTRAPVIRLPWRDGLDGLEGPPAREVFQPFVSRGDTGLSIEGLNSQGGFLLFEAQLAVLDFDGRRATAEDVSGTALEGRHSDYWVYRIPRPFTATTPGTVTFPPARITGTFADRILRNGRLGGSELVAVSESTTFTVRAVPRTGRPAHYTGGIGRFAISATAQPTALKVGDPTTFTLIVRGEGNLDDIGPPDLTVQPGFEDSFRIYEPSAETLDERTRRFTWSLRPIRDDVDEIPPASLSWFDVETESFKEAASDALTLEVTAARSLDAADIISSTAEEPVTPRDLRAAEDGLFGDVVDRSDVRHDRPHLTLWSLALAAGPAAWLIAAVAAGFWRRRHGDPAAVRRRAAASRARRGLAEARALSSPAAYADAARAVLTGLVGDALGRTDASGMTERDIGSALLDWTVDESLRRDVDARWAEWDAARYGAADGGLDGLMTRSQESIEQVVDALRGAKVIG